METISDLGYVLAMWSVTGAACLGWGALYHRATRGGRVVGPEWAGLFWSGFAVLIGLLQMWHLFLAVDWVASGVLLGAGVCAGYLCGAFRRLPVAITPGRLVIFLVVAVWLAYRGMGFPRNYDSGLYHFATISWINSFPVVPGLANLHDRLGFNQSYFLFLGLLNVHPLFGEGYHTANSLLCFVLVSQCLGTALNAVVGNGRSSPVLVLQCILLPVVLAHALGGDVSSPTPDFAVFIVTMAAFIQLARFLAAGETAADSLDQQMSILIAVLLAGCTLKLSFIAFAFSSLVVAILFGHQRRHGVAWVPLRADLVLIVVGGLFWGVPYAIHGTILSGYPCFPSTVFAWDCDWRLPLHEAQDAANWVFSWARTPGASPQQVLGNWNWLGPWCARNLANPAVFIPLLAATGGTVAVVLAVRREVAKWRIVASALPHTVPVLAGLTCWFFTAPDPRFARSLLWLLGAWPLSCAIWLLNERFRWVGRRALAVMGICGSVGVVVLGTPFWLGRIGSGFCPLPQVGTREYITDSGLRVYLPTDDQEVRLWDAPLPSAPSAKPRLELRGSGLADGFRTRGGAAANP